MTVHQSFAIDFRHGTGIKHTNPNHGPLFDKSDPLLNLLATSLDVKACKLVQAMVMCAIVGSCNRNDRNYSGKVVKHFYQLISVITHLGSQMQ